MKRSVNRAYPSDWNTRRKRVYQRDGYQCQNCGAVGGPKGDAKLNAHHIVQKSKGGTHSLSNLKTLCTDCHSAVHDDGVLAPTATNFYSTISTARYKSQPTITVSDAYLISLWIQMTVITLSVLSYFLGMSNSLFLVFLLTPSSIFTYIWYKKERRLNKTGHNREP